MLLLIIYTTLKINYVNTTTENNLYYKIVKKLTQIRINLNTRQLCDLELIMNGGFSPLKGFLNKEDYKSVVNKMRLTNGKLWPIPTVLDVEDKNNYKVNQKITLCDEYGKPLALFTIESIYKPNKKLEAKKVYGTCDINHFGVSQLFYNTGEYYLGGSIKSLNRKSQATIRLALVCLCWETPGTTVIAVPLRQWPHPQGRHRLRPWCDARGRRYGWQGRKQCTA